jgi:hypothetical protein
VIVAAVVALVALVLVALLARGLAHVNRDAAVSDHWRDEHLRDRRDDA